MEMVRRYKSMHLPDRGRPRALLSEESFSSGLTALLFGLLGLRLLMRCILSTSYEDIRLDPSIVKKDTIMIVSSSAPDNVIGPIEALLTSNMRCFSKKSFMPASIEFFLLLAH